jgi:hypothetical protein
MENWALLQICVNKFLILGCVKARTFFKTEQQLYAFFWVMHQHL